MLLSHVFTVKTMRTAVSLLDTGVAIILVYPSLIPAGSKHCIWCHGLLTLRLATSQPLHLRGSILLYLHLGEFCTRVRFVIVLHIAVEILLGVVFIVSFIS